MSSDEIISSTNCPTCASMGQENRLRNRRGRYETYCPLGHTWSETEERDRAIALARRNFPQFYPAPNRQAAPPPPSGPIVFDEHNLRAIEELLGERVTAAAEIKSAIIQFKQEILQLNEQISRQVSQNRSLTRGASAAQLGLDQIILTIPESCLSAVTAFAESEGKPMAQYLQEQLTDYLETNYCNPVPTH